MKPYKREGMREYMIEDRADKKFAEFIKKESKTMTNVPANTTERTLMPISKIFADASVEDLGEGIRSALAQLSINQNVFGINHRGVYESLPNDQLRQVEIVILKSAKTQSKAFWQDGYNPGSNRSPDCWSSTSLTPDPQVPVPISKTCATCPNDAFVTNPNGLKQKLCGDHKRLAIVPAGDLLNEAYGGAMIFRVPAGSLGALDKYGSDLKKAGIPYYAYTTWVTIMLDPQKKTTKLQFEWGRPLSDDEALIVKELRDDEKSGRIVNELLEYEPQEEELGATPKAAAPVAQAKATPPAATPAATPAAASPVAPQRPVAPAPGQMRPSERIATQTEPRQAPISRPAPATTISAAVAKPAVAPPSQRTVVQTPPVEENLVVPDEMNELFGDLMNR